MIEVDFVIFYSILIVASTATAHSSGGTSRIGYVTAKKINLSNVSKIRVVGNCSSARTSPGSAGVGIAVLSSQSLLNTAIVTKKIVTTVGNFDVSLDVSNLNSSYYIIMYAVEDMQNGYSNGSTGSGTFSKLMIK